MNDFRKQISEDIKEYQTSYSYINNIHKDEWAFNYWILDKLFYEDEELIEGKIIDYHDMGIDAYEIYEDTKEIYLLQNKYYSDSTAITADYIKNDFLLKGITALENGTYKRSDELQMLFTKYKDNDDFTVYLQLFVTNNIVNDEAEEYIKRFNIEHPKYHAKIFYLKDIEDRYYGEIKEVKQNLNVRIESVNNGTILKVNTEAYKLKNVLDARYVLTPVASIYNFYKNALEKDYPIFDMNIREYLGNKGINKAIYETLLDEKDRNNFFYYNNGITIICDKMHSIQTKSSSFNMNAYFEIENPQIVNGCQTVNSIYEALKNVPANKDIRNEYKDTFVMVKILEIDRNNINDKELYKNIVKYNNSQNAIDEKTFESNKSIFVRLQKEFEEKGFLLLIKQSDKNKFSVKYKTISKLKSLNNERMNRFKLDEPKKASDLYIPLEKFLQVINAFVSGGYTAYVKKSNMLKYGSNENSTAVNFIKNGDVTNDILLDLYLLYKRAEKAKKEDDNRSPIPYYLIDGFSKYECDNRNPNKIKENLSNSGQIDNIIRLYTAVSKAYTKDYYKEYNVDYNKMIKQNIDYEILDKYRDTIISVI